jgi:uncharacterized protein YuzE
MDADMKEITGKIKEANENWKNRMQGQAYDLQYDHEADIFYISFGNPRDAFSIPADPEDEDEVYVRVDTETYEIVGIDIMLFRSHFLPRHPDAQDALNPLVNLLGDSDWRVQIKRPSDHEDGEFAVFLPDATPPPKFVEYFRQYIPRAAPELVPA